MRGSFVSTPFFYLVFGVLSFGALQRLEGCKTVTREPVAYQAEVSWDEVVEAAAAAPVLAQARSSTSAAGCRRLADLGFALQYRAPYRAAMRRFVAGLGPDPGVAPLVPDVKTICAGLAGGQP